MNSPTPLTARSAVAALLLVAAVPFLMFAASRPAVAAGALAFAVGIGLLARAVVARLRRSSGLRGRLRLPGDVALEFAVTRGGR